jgi:hypothetical protein
MAEKSAMRLDLFEMVGAVVGAVVAYFITSHMPGVYTAVAGAVIIALLTFASGRQTQPILWWAGVGAIAGSVVGTGVRLDGFMAEEGVAHKAAIRYTGLGTLAVAGLLSGIFLGKDIEQKDTPHPAELLKRASGLTAVLFAIIVTEHFCIHGLESARTLSSRLSAVTTILVTTLAVPAWVGYLVGQRIGERMRAALNMQDLTASDRRRAPSP